MEQEQLQIRAKILGELIKAETPLHFSALYKKIEKPKSTRTLTKYLINLEKEGLISRKIEGRKIVFEANKPKTIIQLRKEFLQQLLSLLPAYGNILNEKTYSMTQNYLKAIEESIEKPEPEAERTKVFSRTIKIPEGFKGEIGFPISKPSGKIEFRKAEEIKCEFCGEQHLISEDMHGFYYECPKEKKVKRIEERIEERDLTVEPLRLKRKRKGK